MLTRSEFFITWDTTILTPGTYDLTAVAKYKVGSTDLSPSIITIVVDHSSPDYSEDVIKKDKDSVIRNGDGTKVEIPAGVLTEDTVIRISKPTRAELPPLKENPTGIYLKIVLESSQRVLNRPVTISMPYPDVDNNGIVDGTNIYEKYLKVNIWDGTNWKELPTHIDAINNIVTGITLHFTIFSAFGALAKDLDDVWVFPNPFRQGGGDTVIKFLNLTEGTTVRIYNIAGELVKMQENITTGSFDWNTRNDFEEKVSSGVYIYIITDNESRIRKGKIAIIK